MLAASLVVCLGLSTCAQAAPAQNDLARAVMTAYEANRASLTKGVVRYQFFSGFAPDQAKAWSGAWDDRSEAKCFFAFDGRRARFERVYSVEDLAAHTVRDANGSTSSLMPTRILTDGKATLVDYPSPSEDGKELRHQVVIKPGIDEFSREFDFITGLGSSAGSDVDLYGLRKALAGEGGYRLEAPEDARLDDGTEVVHLAIVASDHRVDYWIDLQHGAVPRRVRTSNSDGSLWDVMEYDDVRLVGDAAWFPFRQRMFFFYRKALEYRIVSADFKRSPDDSVFRLEFDEPVGVQDLSRNMNYSAQKVWDLAHLPNPGSPQARRFTIAEPGPPPPIQPGPEKPTPWSYYLLTAVGIILIGLASARSIRNRWRTDSS